MDNDRFLKYDCNVETEPPWDYKPRGLHPVYLGDYMHDGRYHILHKLGWGAWSTVWAARDEKENRYVAIKVAVADDGIRPHESKILQVIADAESQHPGKRRLPVLLDQFDIAGPNGSHHCIVLEILGPAITTLIDWRGMRKLPGPAAKEIARQVLEGLDYLHQQGITHGDLHTGNISLRLPFSLDALSEDELVATYDKPVTAPVTRKNGESLEHGMATYLVAPPYYEPDLFSDKLDLSSPQITIIDFGGAFVGSNRAENIHTPLVVRAPEAILDETVDYRVDLWSLGCMIFELVGGQPPLDSVMITEPDLIGQMLDRSNDVLPDRWRSKWTEMLRRSTDPEKAFAASTGPSLQEWLETVYFDERNEIDLSRENIRMVGDLVRKLLRFEPGERWSARQALEHEWFRDVQTDAGEKD